MPETKAQKTALIGVALLVLITILTAWNAFQLRTLVREVEMIQSQKSTSLQGSSRFEKLLTELVESERELVGFVKSRKGQTQWDEISNELDQINENTRAGLKALADESSDPQLERLVDEILAGLDNAMTTTDPAENARICTDKMRELVKLAMIYSDDAGTRYFPYSPEGGVASLQILADFFTDRVKPDMLICPESEDVPAVAGPDGKLKLTRENCSFGMVPKKLDPGDLDDVLMYCRHTHPGGKRIVVYTNTFPETLTEQAFQELMGR